MESRRVNDKKTFLLPAWVREWAMRLLPWAFTGIVAASIGLYTDNIANKKDIDRNNWRNDQQDGRLDRNDGWRDRVDARLDKEEEFHKEAIDRLEALLERENVKRTKR